MRCCSAFEVDMGTREPELARSSYLTLAEAGAVLAAATAQFL
jgi:hypothetical protein